ncbi:pentraxin-4 [Ctenodactylus gundi]
MGHPGKRSLPFLLIFVYICIHKASGQNAGFSRQRKPFFERLRRLEEQFRRFQEVTLTHLQEIANNYNVSYSIDTRFQTLAEENRAMALAINQSQAAVQGDLAHLKTWVRKVRHQSRRVDARLQALDLALSPGSWPQAQEGRERQVLQDTLARLMHQVHSQGARLAAVEVQLRMASPETRAQPARPEPSSSAPQKDSQEPKPSPYQRTPPYDPSARPQGKPTVAQRGPPQPAWHPQGPGDICNVGPVLVFPNASTQNVVFLRPSFLKALRALSFCSWVRTATGYLGTLLSYATEDNDNKLVLHGRDSLVPGAMHLVIGDPAFRELPLQLLLDGQWHHVCVIWTSTQGRYWLHVDRRLVATGSRFREGYEIPPGGSLVLGQEQDLVGGGFDSAEAFVGNVAGMAIWDRALVPGEVTDLATGKEAPPGAILTLAEAKLEGGFVGRANCTCLGHCP